MKKLRIVLLFCSLVNTVHAQVPKKYNVILIIVDDMSIAFEPFGNAQAPTPNFLRLMKHGVLFKQAYVQYALCSPSRTSLLSGQRPDSTGVVNNGVDVRWKLGADYRFLPEYFHDFGYRTESFGKVGPCGHSEEVTWDHVFKANDTDKGFEHFPIWWIDTLAKSLKDTRGGVNVDSALAKIRHPVAKPYFYGLGLTTHNPFTPTLASWNKTGDATQKVLLPVDQYGTITNVRGNSSRNIILPDTPPDDTADIPRPAITELINFSAQQVRDLRHAYYGEIIEADANLGTLLNGLDSMHLWDSSIIIFTSDHGLHLGEHEGLWLKKTLFEEALRVPLVICAPGKKKGVVCDRPVELVDIFPTLTELCGLPTARNMQGSSLVPLLENPKTKWKEAIFAQRVLDIYRHDQAGDPMGRAVRTGKFHYNNWLQYGEELYDIINDPKEYTNLAGNPDYRDTLRRMRRLLQKGWQGVEPQPYAKTSYYRDADGDGYGNSSESILAYFTPDGYTDKNGDCDDNDKEIFPRVGKSCSSVASDIGIPSEKISISPNPSAGILKVTYNSKKAGKVYLNIYDRVGRLVFRRTEIAVSGSNSFQLLLYNLKPGVFDLSLNDGVVTRHAKFEIERR